MDLEKEEIDKISLDVLRKNTNLDLISEAKILLSKRRAEKQREIYIKQNPNDIIEVDYSDALELEYQLRKNAWVKSCEKAWMNYIKIENDGCGLFEFANGNLNRIIEEERKYNKKYTKMKSKL